MHQEEDLTLMGKFCIGTVAAANRGAVAIACAIGLTALTSHAAFAGDIAYRNFSASAAIGPPADEFAAKLQNVTRTALGISGEVRFVRLAGIPAIPAQFAGDIVSAVAAGQVGGGFDAAYISGSDLNRTWGFIFNSGVPFGPTFDEFSGFLFGKAIDNGTKTGLDLVQELLEARRRNIVAIPIVGSPEQMSGYFAAPMETVGQHRGIGLSGLCQQPWTLRYLPPGENVLNQACDDLVASGRIPRKTISFIAAIPGGGSLVDAVQSGSLHGFEFATPFDDVSQLFNGPNNPGTVGVRFVHTPGWQQQFLVTWMIVNKQVWSSLSAGQQLIAQTVARDHVISSYAENLRQQGPALKFILDANKNDGNPNNDIVLTKWPVRDQVRLRDAAIRFLTARADDGALPSADRADYVRILEALRVYVRANDPYWDNRQVITQLRFEDWANRFGECWEDRCDPRRCEPGVRP
jgi:TRAP-type mannitol/chloroaromatic compound transport system substrate-binding protein